MFGLRWPGTDVWQPDDSCGYCGSLNPDILMSRIEAGTVELEPTDKNYKVYVRNRGGAQFQQRYRDCPAGSNCSSPDACTHWVTRETEHAKFYFQHFSEAQARRFVELLGTRKLHIASPGHFYVLPFFVAMKSRAHQGNT
jgi:hypothetical protein